MPNGQDVYAHKVAESLLEIEAVGFPDQPITFKSGIQSPVYVDNRRFPYFPSAWKTVIEGFAYLTQREQLDFECIAGIETAGIPHSATLGFYLQKPSLFVRKQVKDHGTKKRVEGGEVAGKKVLLIEDHITTGGSSLSGVEALRAEGATVTDCLAITSYEFADAAAAFSQAGVRLHTLTTFNHILDEASNQKILQKNKIESVKKWLQDPHHWSGQ
jgi:orotate phosphoribosyltransferase